MISQRNYEVGEELMEAFVKAAKIAHDAERDVALTLSDAFCVDRYRADRRTAQRFVDFAADAGDDEPERVVERWSWAGVSRRLLEPFGPSG